jgi:hypothetical protein
VVAGLRSGKTQVDARLICRHRLAAFAAHFNFIFPFGRTLGDAQCRCLCCYSPSSRVSG